MNLLETQQWKSLQQHFDTEIAASSIVDFLNDKSRFENFSLSFDQLLIDFSKQKINSETIDKLIQLAEAAGLKQSIQNLFDGKPVNSTENRAALHSALRFSGNQAIDVDGSEVADLVEQQLSKMSQMIDALTKGEWLGYSGKPISTVVNLGVGGSELGPLLACHALDSYSKAGPNPIELKFVSSIDGTQICSLLEKLNPETTLFIVASKSFTTLDTLSNANTALHWFLDHSDKKTEILQHHFIGISNSITKMSEWGIPVEHQLKIWNWVGGRFSLWSSVGFSIALKIGMQNFRELLKGASALDEHFLNTDLEKNIPVLLGLIAIWNTNFQDIGTHAILPYDARLKHLPHYLMQLEMESTGKSITKNGKKIEHQTGQIIVGDVGSNAQHAINQLFHQGTRKVSCDFIATINRSSECEGKQNESLYQQHLLSLANCFAQSKAFMEGTSAIDVECEETNYKYHPGEHPSTTILLKKLSPYSLGQLIALYEHKVFVMASIWRINPFDQPASELGRKLAKQTLNNLENDKNPEDSDISTNGLIDWIKEFGE